MVIMFFQYPRGTANSLQQMCSALWVVSNVRPTLNNLTKINEHDHRKKHLLPIDYKTTLKNVLGNALFKNNKISGILKLGRKAYKFAHKIDVIVQRIGIKAKPKIYDEISA